MTELSYEGRIVFCADVSATAALYERVLGLRRAFQSGGDIGMTLPVADSADATVTFYLHPASAPTPADLGLFRVSDVDAFVERCRAAGFVIVSEPADTPWRTRDASLNDPDGNGLSITAPLQSDTAPE